jgi:hypothetical protein
MSTEKIQTYFADVGSLSQSQDDYVPANGEVVEVSSFAGSASYIGKTVVKLVWDPDGTPEVLAATHGDAQYRLIKKVTGNGTKKLSIICVNDSNSIHTLGGQWTGRVTSP